jgi:cell division protein ZipA
MSETLRWILIGFSVVLLVGIYLWGRRGSQSTSEDAALRMRPEPTIPPADDAFAEPEPALESEPVEYERGDDAWAGRSSGRTRVEPTFTDTTAELPVESVIEPVAPEDMEAIEEQHAAPEAPEVVEQAPAEHAPTLSMSSTPPPKRIERRKIIALRLAAAPQRFEGSKLRAALESESLQHGKYQVFHRLHSDGTSIFSIASMVEPGIFELSKMGETQYPGITLFAQLPGPVPGMHALNELVACARRLHQTLGGTLQDDRGVPLTVHRIERLRQEIREFERPPSVAPHAAGH